MKNHANASKERSREGVSTCDEEGFKSSRGKYLKARLTIHAPEAKSMREKKSKDTSIPFLGARETAKIPRRANMTEDMIMSLSAVFMTAFKSLSDVFKVLLPFFPMLI